MILSELQVTDFRNFQNLRLSLSGGVTVIQGPNAQGKTNLLEAIGLLSLGRSFRTRDEREILPWNCETGTTAVVRGTLDGPLGCHRISVSIQARRKQVTLDEQPLRRLGDLLGHLRAVVFEPQDMDLVHGAPAQRRRLLDLLLVQVDRDHLDHLQRYDSALKHRNSLLRQLSGQPPDPTKSRLLDTYEEILVQHGPVISSRRRQILGTLQPDLQSHYRSMRGLGSEDVEIEFQSGWGRQDLDNESLLRDYRANRDTDRQRGSATLGSHRDDFRYSMDGRRAADYASQGQRRTLVIATKLAEVSCLRTLAQYPPLLLLDDLLSELDDARQTGLLAALPRDTQTVITATDASRILVPDARVLLCRQGQILPRDP